MAVEIDDINAHLNDVATSTRYQRIFDGGDIFDPSKPTVAAIPGPDSSYVTKGIDDLFSVNKDNHMRVMNPMARINYFRSLGVCYADNEWWKYDYAAGYMQAVSNVALFSYLQTQTEVALDMDTRDKLGIAQTSIESDFYKYEEGVMYVGRVSADNLLDIRSDVEEALFKKRLAEIEATRDIDKLATFWASRPLDHGDQEYFRDYREPKPIENNGQVLQQRLCEERSNVVSDRISLRTLAQVHGKLSPYINALEMDHFDCEAANGLLGKLCLGGRDKYSKGELVYAAHYIVSMVEVKLLQGLRARVGNNTDAGWKLWKNSVIRKSVFREFEETTGIGEYVRDDVRLAVEDLFGQNPDLLTILLH